MVTALLRRRVSQLTGYTRPVSDGSLYPAINRLTKAGLLERRADPGAGPARYVLSLTGAGPDLTFRHSIPIIPRAVCQAGPVGRPADL